jgi:hypothetical protein
MAVKTQGLNTTRFKNLRINRPKVPARFNGEKDPAHYSYHADSRTTTIIFNNENTTGWILTDDEVPQGQKIYWEIEVLSPVSSSDIGIGIMAINSGNPADVTTSNIRFNTNESVYWTPLGTHIVNGNESGGSDPWIIYGQNDRVMLEFDRINGTIRPGLNGVWEGRTSGLPAWGSGQTTSNYSWYPMVGTYTPLPQTLNIQFKEHFSQSSMLYFNQAANDAVPFTRFAVTGE